MIERFGQKAAFRGPPASTLLLSGVVDASSGVTLTDHVWFAAGRWSRTLRAGDVIEFDARVGTYLKGYLGRREDVGAPVQKDWRLERPTKVVNLGGHATPVDARLAILHAGARHQEEASSPEP